MPPPPSENEDHGNNGNSDNCNGVGHDNNGNGNGSGNPECDYYNRTVKAVIVNLQRVDIYSTSVGWVQAVDLRSEAHPDGSFYELIGVKNGAKPELGIFQLPEDDYTAVRFYFGHRNHVIAQDQAGVLDNYDLNIETEEDSVSLSQNRKLKSRSKGYRVTSKKSNKQRVSGTSRLRQHHADDNTNIDEGGDDDDDAAERFVELQISGGFYIDPESVMEITVGVDPVASVRQHKDKYSFNPVITIENIRPTTGASTLISAASGGTVIMQNSAGDNEVTIDFPPGALTQDTWVAVIPKAEVTAGNYRPEFIDMANYVFLPHNLTMNSDAELTIQYDGNFISDLNEGSGNNLLTEDLIDIQYFDDVEQRYKSAGRNIDKENHTAVAYINHFSDWEVGPDVSADLWFRCFLAPMAWQTCASALLEHPDSWNTTQVNPSSQTMQEGVNHDGNYAYDLALWKDANGALLYVPESDTYREGYVYADDGTQYAYTTLAYRAIRPLFKHEIEQKWARNERYYTPGYPMEPELFIISLNNIFDTQDLNKSGLFDVPGYASVASTGILFPNATIGAYLFFHVAQRHDKCNGRGDKTYDKSYVVCNQDFYGSTENPLPLPSTMNQYPSGVRNPVFFNTASICNAYSQNGGSGVENGIYQRCLMARDSFQNFLEATASDISILRERQICDDYDLKYVTMPDSDPEKLYEQRHKYCLASDGGIDIVAAYNGEHCPDNPNGCTGGLPIDTNTGKIPGVNQLTVEKICPDFGDSIFDEANVSYLQVAWQLDQGWAGMPFTPDNVINKYIHVSLSPKNRTDRNVLGMILDLLLGSYITVPQDPASTNDKKLPYFFTQSPYGVGWFAFAGLINPVSTPTFIPYADTINNLYSNSITVGTDGTYVTYKIENLIPTEVLAYPNGNYNIEVQPVAILDFDGPVPVYGAANVTKYCNPEIVNFCWDKRNLANEFYTDGRDKCPPNQPPTGQ